MTKLDYIAACALVGMLVLTITATRIK
jgi:hypothetical protein